MPAYARSKHLLLKVTAVLAYVSCLLQWFFVVFPFVPIVVESGAFEVFTPGRSQPVEATPVQADMLPGWAIAPLIVVIITGVIVVTFVSLFRAPRAIGETAQKASQAVARRVVPVVSHHRKISKKKQLALSARIIFDLKLLLLAVPLILIFFVPMDHIQVSRELLVLVVAVLAGWELFLFCSQIVLARLFRIPFKELW